jgi:hypothetical protein
MRGIRPDPLFPDHETDAIIQNTLRTELGPDATVLTIAHRLQTIMDADKIVRVTDHHCLQALWMLMTRKLDGFGWWPHCKNSLVDISVLFFTDDQTEFATPAELLRKDKSVFKAMVDESGDKGRLYDVAKRKQAPLVTSC